MPIITISRQMGSLGDEVAEALKSKTDSELITRDKLINRFFLEITDDREKHLLNESAKFYLAGNDHVESFKTYLENELIYLSQNRSLILVGFGSQIIFKDIPEAVHVRIVAPKKTRIARIKKHYRVSDIEAEHILSMADRRHKRFVNTVFKQDISDIDHYHSIFNTGVTDVDSCVRSILALQEEHLLRVKLVQESQIQDTTDHSADFHAFKNESEAEFARILDMYQIDWKYEPKTFPVEWDVEGNITQALSPDFYLPKFDTYLELTTMNQKYVTEKNKKLKKVRELYPGTNIRIVYKKDFMSLIERFKLLSGVADLDPSDKGDNQ